MQFRFDTALGELINLNPEYLTINANIYSNEF